MFCRKPLGTNEVIETFPVGRRLAFDEARGRLWVVCRKCERWNLSPLEERWEAVEDCERIFRSTRVRVSTDNIGLARHPEGLTLVRIGEPMRPEFAAWRYGDQFGRRRRRQILYGTGAAVVIGGCRRRRARHGRCSALRCSVRAATLVNAVDERTNAGQAPSGGRGRHQAQETGPAGYAPAPGRRRHPASRSRSARESTGRGTREPKPTVSRAPSFPG